MAVVLATGAILLANYQDALTSFITPSLNSGWAWTQDHLFPMPGDTLIAVNLKFYIPGEVNKTRTFEGLSATLAAAHCKQAGGASIVRTFDGGERDSYTHAIVSISCRASGRTLVTLTPQSGSTQTLYDGTFKDGEKQAFPGVPGSYYAGLLTLNLLDMQMPDGPRVPVNKCQITNSCAQDFGENLEGQTLRP